MGDPVRKLSTSRTVATLKPLSLRKHPEFNEAWLQQLVTDSPSILNLGDLETLDKERRQPQGGRLDLLLSDAEGNTRYEVELQLGSTDEAHIIRCIEYWDVERRRYPAYEHIAVLIAEDVTSRFLNVISLFAGNIPMIVMQVNAYEIDGNIGLTFTKILDQTLLREDDEIERDTEPKDRSYWLKKATKATVEIADNCLDLINRHTPNALELNYNKFYIGLRDGLKANNFVSFRPKKSFTHIVARIDNIDDWIDRFGAAEIAAKQGRKSGRIQVTVSERHLKNKIALLEEFFAAIVRESGA